MVLGIAISKNGIPIRLTDERWIHIILAHKEISSGSFSKILNTVENPDAILKGDTGELLAVKVRARLGKKSWLVVAYKEANKFDGFIITAYVTTDKRWLFKREIVWNKEL